MTALLTPELRSGDERPEQRVALLRADGDVGMVDHRPRGRSVRQPRQPAPRLLAALGRDHRAADELARAVQDRCLDDEPAPERVALDRVAAEADPTGRGEVDGDR